ncbi:hypothetical protein RJT34_17555 [Clitoria ternatea]|uniref:Uncharacterized protein n=1 Tax=Clitoria ternatea TaxID=43366 RepID=A0AAN9PD89_CLITE
MNRSKLEPVMSMAAEGAIQEAENGANIQSNCKTSSFSSNEISMVGQKGPRSHAVASSRDPMQERTGTHCRVPET